MILPKADKTACVYTTAIKLLLLLLLISFNACTEKRTQQKTEHAFYYWKSVLKLSDFEKQKLDSLQVKTIYLKFFDVDWDEAGKKPVPVAKLQAPHHPVMQAGEGGILPGNISIIPVIFITNACIQKIDSAQVKQLAEKMYGLILEIKRSNGFTTSSEIQIDCDWTAASKEKYFLLLNNFKRQAPDSRISCTIRLHQVKFLSKTGVPPVDRGLLMCYNMGNLKDPATKNSIIETAELEKYTGNLSGYPLPLDVAFPLFEWKVLYRHNQYAGLIQNLPDTVFNNAFTGKTGNRYVVLKDSLLEGYDLQKGDMIRSEKSDIKEVLAAADAISRHLKNTPRRVSLYHLDSLILSKYTTHELESIYNSMH